MGHPAMADLTRTHTRNASLQKNRAKPWTFDSLVIPDEVTLQSTKKDGGSLLRVLFSGNDLCKYTPKNHSLTISLRATNELHLQGFMCKEDSSQVGLDFQRDRDPWLINKSAL